MNNIYLDVYINFLNFQRRFKFYLKIDNKSTTPIFILFHDFIISFSLIYILLLLFLIDLKMNTFETD